VTSHAAPRCANWKCREPLGFGDERVLCPSCALMMRFGLIGGGAFMWIGWIIIGAVLEWLKWQ
jgi:hypothetical protein